MSPADGVEFGLSTSMIQDDLRRLALLSRFAASHVEVGFVAAADLATVMTAVGRQGLGFGFHDPLPWHPAWRWPSLTDPDRAERARSLEVMDHTLATATEYGAAYALAHFPSVHFQAVPAWSRRQALAAAHETAATLSRRSQESRTPILLENVGPSPYWDAEAWVEIMETYPALGFCLDVGHVHLVTGGDHDADLAFVEALAPFTDQVHVYNATVESYRRYHHVPAHPDQEPSAGWIDLAALLDCVTKNRPPGPLRIVFEHTPEYPADEVFVAEGMAWVRDLVTDGVSAPSGAPPCR